LGSGYRYGFNGKERDIVGLGGGGSTYDYGFRIYNPQLGKFLSVDPLTSSFPWYTPYQFAGNKPIVAIDLDGLEEYIVTDKIVDGKRIRLSKTDSYDVIKANYEFIEGHSEKIVGGDVEQFYGRGLAPTTGTLTITINEDGSVDLNYKFEKTRYDQANGRQDSGNSSTKIIKSTSKHREQSSDDPYGRGGEGPKNPLMNFVDRITKIIQELDLWPSTVKSEETTQGSTVSEPIKVEQKKKTFEIDTLPAGDWYSQDDIPTQPVIIRDKKTGESRKDTVRGFEKVKEVNR
jgi:RHS repeat-associated protein